MSVENAPKIPKYFADTASMAQLERMMRLPEFKGITTNPSIVAREATSGGVDAEAYYRQIATRFPGVPVSVQLIDCDLSKAIAEAERLASLAPNIVIKVPMFGCEPDPSLVDGKGNIILERLEEWMKFVSENEQAGGIQIIAALSKKGLKTNVTALMTTQQAVAAIHAGIDSGKQVDYVSLFFNRILDGKGDPQREISETREYIDRFGLATEIIIGSIRDRSNITKAELWGAHIVTIPPDAYWQNVVWHPQTVRFTREARDNFNKAFGING